MCRNCREINEMLLIVIRTEPGSTNGNSGVLIDQTNLPKIYFQTFPLLKSFLPSYSIDPLINRVKEPQTMTTNETEIILEMEIKLPKILLHLHVSFLDGFLFDPLNISNLPRLKVI